MQRAKGRDICLDKRFTYYRYKPARKGPTTEDLQAARKAVADVKRSSQRPWGAKFCLTRAILCTGSSRRIGRMLQPLRERAGQTTATGTGAGG